jgi:hypothetical protein
MNCLAFVPGVLLITLLPSGPPRITLPQSSVSITAHLGLFATPVCVHHANQGKVPPFSQGNRAACRILSSLRPRPMTVKKGRPWATNTERCACSGRSISSPPSRNRRQTPWPPRTILSIRAGLVRQVAAGSFIPTCRSDTVTLRKIENIIREEMNARGGHRAAHAGPAAAVFLGGDRPCAGHGRCPDANQRQRLANGRGPRADHTKRSSPRPCGLTSTATSSFRSTCTRSRPSSRVKNGPRAASCEHARVLMKDAYSFDADLAPRAGRQLSQDIRRLLPHL